MNDIRLTADMLASLAFLAFSCGLLTAWMWSYNAYTAGRADEAKTWIDTAGRQGGELIRDGQKYWVGRVVEPGDGDYEELDPNPNLNDDTRWSD